MAQEQKTVIGHYTIQGLRIPLVEITGPVDVRFLSQRNLFRLGSAEALTELQRRAAILNAR